MSQDDKLEALHLGSLAENMTAEEYLKAGYAIVARNWRMGKTEIDIIAQKDDMIVFIEVKARTEDDVDPNETVTTDKRRRMIRAADAYLKNQTGNFFYRFDIATLSGNPENWKLEILEDAFLAADLF